MRGCGWKRQQRGTADPSGTPITGNELKRRLHRARGRKKRDEERKERDESEWKAVKPKESKRRIERRSIPCHAPGRSICIIHRGPFVAERRNASSDDDPFADARFWLRRQRLNAGSAVPWIGRSGSSLLILLLGSPILVVDLQIGPFELELGGRYQSRFFLRNHQQAAPFLSTIMTGLFVQLKEPTACQTRNSVLSYDRGYRTRRPYGYKRSETIDGRTPLFFQKFP